MLQIESDLFCRLDRSDYSRRRRIQFRLIQWRIHRSIESFRNLLKIFKKLFFYLQVSNITRVRAGDLESFEQKAHLQVTLGQVENLFQRVTMRNGVHFRGGGLTLEALKRLLFLVLLFSLTSLLISYQTLY